jgi:FAD/FMN-containing dehydrogenase
VEAEAAALGFAPFLFGHLADGNLHILFNHAGPFASETAARVEEILYRDLRALGGSFSAEHGVGSKRIGALNAAADPGKLALMATVKRALDPKGLMNPGKLFCRG